MSATIIMRPMDVYIVVDNPDGGCDMEYCAEECSHTSELDYTICDLFNEILSISDTWDERSYRCEECMKHFGSGNEK